MHPGIQDALESKYLNDAKRNEAKRGKKIREVQGLKGKSEDEGSVPPEPSSEEWDGASDDDDDDDDDDDEGFEGGDDQANSNHINLSDAPNANRESQSSKTPKKGLDGMPIKGGKNPKKKKKAGKSCLSKLVKKKNVIQTVDMKYPKELPKVKGTGYKALKKDEEVEVVKDTKPYDKEKHAIYNK